MEKNRNRTEDRKNRKRIIAGILLVLYIAVIGANSVIEPYCIVGDSCTLKSGTIVKSTSMVAMNTSTEQGSVRRVHDCKPQEGEV